MANPSTRVRTRVRQTLRRGGVVRHMCIVHHAGESEVWRGADTWWRRIGPVSNGGRRTVVRPVCCSLDLTGPLGPSLCGVRRRVRRPGSDAGVQRTTAWPLAATVDSFEWDAWQRESGRGRASDQATDGLAARATRVDGHLCDPTALFRESLYLSPLADSSSLSWQWILWV
jgi:hypothetical protein